MKAFWKDNSYVIVKLILNQLAIVIFSALLAATYPYQFIYLMTSVFSILFYLFLASTVVYEIGAKDCIRIEAGRMKATPWRGFWVGLCAGSLNVLIGIVIGVAALFKASGNLAERVYAVCVALARIGQAMYLGVINVFHLGAWCYLIIPLPAIFVCPLVYYLAQRGVLAFRSNKKKSE